MKQVYKPYATVVHLGESDRALAADKSERIYDMLGPEFFQDIDRQGTDRARVIRWIEHQLLTDDLCVQFYDAQDALLFKMTFA